MPSYGSGSRPSLAALAGCLLVSAAQREWTGFTLTGTGELEATFLQLFQNSAGFARHVSC